MGRPQGFAVNKQGTRLYRVLGEGLSWEVALPGDKISTKVQRQQRAWCGPQWRGSSGDLSTGWGESTQQRSNNRETGGMEGTTRRLARRPAHQPQQWQMVFIFYISTCYRAHARVAMESYKIFKVNLGLIYRKSDISLETNTRVAENLSETWNNTGIRAVSQSTQRERITFLCYLGEIIISFSVKHFERKDGGQVGGSRVHLLLSLIWIPGWSSEK